MFKEYKALFLDFLRDKWYVFAMSLTIALSYSFFVFNFSPNVEDLSFDLYYGSNNLLVSVGRFGTVIIDKILGIYAFRPTVMPILGILALCISAILWCCLFRRASSGKLSRFAYIIFACFYIAAPLIHEVLIYTNQVFSIPFALLCTTISVIAIKEYKKSNWNMFWAIVLMMLAMAIYESVLIVFLAGILICFILRKIYTNAYEDEPMFVWKKCWLAVMVSICSMLGRIAVTMLLTRSLLPILPGYSSYTTDYISWVHGNFWTTLSSLWSGLYLNYFLASTYYFPIALWNGALIIGFIAGVIYAVRKRSFSLFVCFILLIMSNFALQIFLGQAMHYRACQIFALYTAFAFMLLAQGVSNISWKPFSVVCCFVVTLVLFWQVNDINKWLFVNNLRYEEDVANFTKIGNDLRDNFDDKPVVFLGNYDYTDRVKQYICVESKSKLGQWFIKNTDYIPDWLAERKYILQRSKILEGTFANWGIVSTGKDFEEIYDPNYFVIEFLKSIGYTVQPGGNYLGVAQRNVNSSSIKFPKKGYIIDAGDYLIVNFGISE